MPIHTRRLAFITVLAGLSGFAPAQEAASNPPDDDGFLQNALEDVFGSEFSRVRVRGRLAAGFSYNPASPSDRINAGRWFDDRSNDFLLRQLGFTVEQSMSPEYGRSDWGFKIDLFAGTDARLSQSLWPFDQMFDGMIQLDLNEAWIHGSLPLGEGALHIRAGLFPTFLGFEVVDPDANWMFSRSFAFAFGTPIKHAGIHGTWHPCEAWDLSFGVVTGAVAGFEDNNDAVALLAGSSARLMDGALSLNLGVFYGPETDTVFAGVVDVDDDRRLILAFTAVLDLGDGWSAALDSVYGHDDARLGLNNETPEWYGAAVYLKKTLSPQWSVAARLEAFRDDDGFATVKIGQSDDYLDLSRGALGALDPSTGGLGATTLYGATLGVTWRPTTSLRFDLEARFDHSSEGSPFDAATSDDQFTLALGALITF